MRCLDFAKYLLALNPEANAARLSLYHFMKNFEDGAAAFSPAVLNHFFARAYSFEHWRKNRSELKSEILPIVEDFLSRHQVDWSKNRIDADLQIIEIENIADLYEVVRSHMNTRRLEGEKVRLLPDGEDGIVALDLKPDGSLMIHYFDKFCTIRAGKIEPLLTDMVVKYSRQLEPAPQFRHHLRVQPGVSAIFTANNTLSGQLIRGYSFTKMEEFSDKPLTQLPVIFYPLKRLERFFINRATDPLYVELTKLLDQTIVLLKEEHPEAMQFASAAFDRGQNALTHIFTDDKLLSLLLRELSVLLFEKTHVGDKNGQSPT